MHRSDGSSCTRDVIVSHYCRPFISDTFKSWIGILTHNEEAGLLNSGPMISVFSEGNLPHEIVPGWLTCVEENGVTLSNVDKDTRDFDGDNVGPIRFDDGEIVTIDREI